MRAWASLSIVILICAVAAPRMVARFERDPETRIAVDASKGDMEALLSEGDRLAAKLSRAKETLFRARAAEWKKLSAPDVADPVQRWLAIRSQSRMPAALLALRRAVALAAAEETFGAIFGSAAPPYVVGWSSPMRRVFLEDLPVDLDIRRRGRVEAFRGEVVATQLVLAPIVGDLRRVEISVGDLVGPQGRIPSDQVEVHPVASVRITEPGSDARGAEHGYAGWWPDPLLNNIALDVTQGSTQAVWLSVRVARDCSPGTYVAPIHIRAADTPPFVIDLDLEVWDVALPQTWHFKNLLSWHDAWASQIYGASWRPELERKFFDFLLDRRINIASMYEENEPYATPERLVEFGARGQNVLVAASVSREFDFGKGKAAVVQRLNDTLPALRAAGLADRALMYGWDERGARWFPEIGAAAELLEKKFDGMPLMMAGVDESYGLSSRLAGHRNVIYCPLMRRYDAREAARARAKGNQVWWYDTHWTIEQPLLRSRLIPWQTFKARADGFLFWCLDRWVGNEAPIEDTIRASWNPNLDGIEPHSSGVYVYPGVDGPRSSLRLENFRSGIQDYDLLSAAEEMLRELESDHGDATRIAALRRVIDVPEDVITDPNGSDFDPDRLDEWRRMLAHALGARATH